eukprot:TRINITY_DN3742_c0_g1_i1.p1 TRINITY_DN3742_c0_g1~~TRINITY_DN3742_c0_g1_i1.p1  ORF type:complete len:285 (+),score=73.89 TRINITY_DN3742_c0_g1_i1:1000-1854(+)
MVEFFCTECQVPVCVHCKMIGNHSTTEMYSHKLVPITQAYSHALTRSSKEDPAVHARKRALQAQLQRIRTLSEDISRNSQQVEDNIYQLLREALFRLQVQVQLKKSTLLSYQIEVERQLEAIEKLDTLLEKEKECLPPVLFLHAWQRHLNLLSEFCPEKGTVLPSVNVKADLTMIGNVDVIEKKVIAKEPKQSPKHTFEEEEVIDELQDPSEEDLEEAALGVEDLTGSSSLERPPQEQDRQQAQQDEQLQQAAPEVEEEESLSHTPRDEAQSGSDLEDSSDGDE